MQIHPRTTILQFAVVLTTLLTASRQSSAGEARVLQSEQDSDCQTTACSAEDQPRGSFKNAAYVSLLGQGLIYSVNYERHVNDFAGRIGFSYLSLGAAFDDATVGGTLWSVPVSIQYLGLGKGSRTLEIGVGIIATSVTGEASGFDESLKRRSTNIIYTTNVGYRYLSPNGAFLFRAGLSPIYGPGSIGFWPWWPYLSFGGAF